MESRYKVGDLVIGKVTMVRPYAVFMTFEGGSNGLLHISEISDAYIRDIERYATTGDEIKVKIIEVDANNGFLRVSLKRVPAIEAYSTHENKNRQVIVTDSNDFQSLKESLPGWIKDALNRAKKEN